jgi:hypothetical protein
MALLARAKLGCRCRGMPDKVIRTVNRLTEAAAYLSRLLSTGSSDLAG